MRTMSQALKDHLAGEVITVCHLWKIERQDGLIVGYTDFDQDIEYDDITYFSLAGFNQSAVKSNITLSVDNLELKAPLGNIPASIADSDLTGITMMTEAEINAGIWDYALVDMLVVNYEDLSMGHFVKKTGNLGQITTGRNTYTAEFRGIQQPLSQQIGRIYTSQCVASLGDSKCARNGAFQDGKTLETDYTFTGTVNKLIDQHSWIDTSLNQTNSTYQRAITGITKQNPVRITCANHGLQTGEKVTLSGISGMTQLNGLTLPITYVSANVFTVAVDGTIFSDYVSGGTATKTTVSEYFKDGYVEWLTGNNAGIKAGVKTYRPNYVMLHDAMTFPIQVGDTYKIVAGCDKLMNTCINRFNNRYRYYGFNLVPGMDKLQSGEGS